MKKQKLQQGDIFSIKVRNSENYIYGRILFDTEKQFDNIGMPNNYLDWHGKSVLIETFKCITEKEIAIDISNLETAVDATFIPKKNLEKAISNIVRNQKADYTKISFPETLRNVERDVLFTVGELAFKTNLSADEAHQINVFPTMGNLFQIELATLDGSGRRDLIEDQSDIKDNFFKYSDLRTHPEIRNKIYKDINLNPEKSYYELATELGIDLGRLF